VSRKLSDTGQLQKIDHASWAVVKGLWISLSLIVIRRCDTVTAPRHPANQCCISFRSCYRWEQRDNALFISLHRDTSYVKKSIFTSHHVTHKSSILSHEPSVECHISTFYFIFKFLSTRYRAYKQS